jgi:hypothetical protein
MRFVRPCALAAFALVAFPAAGELGPQRASDAVHLHADQAVGGCALEPTAFGFNTRVLPNGERPAFAVPKGKVLMVRRIHVVTFNGANVPLDVAVIAGPPGNSFGYAYKSILTDASGVTNLEFDFPVGFAVPEGASVCIVSSAAPANAPNARLEGYLTKAR